MALKDFEGVEIQVIGQGMEKYLTLSLGKYLVFKDSLQFLGPTLATLAKNLLKTGLESFKHLTRHFLGVEAREFRLLVRKGCIRMSIWIAGRRWTSSNSHPRRHSTRS